MIRGASAAATLTNGDKILGAGQLGGGVMKLVNGVGGIIDGNGKAALVINTGVNTITNAGTIENTSTGGTTIKSVVNNTGALTVTAGTLTVTGAVVGSGKVTVVGGTADLAGAFTENVTFTGAAGVLELGHSQAYTGTVTGLSTTGKNALDLADITFASATTKASYSGTAIAGTLTVTDGTHTSHITLEGNYAGHTFIASSDGHGGTTVVDPPRLGGGGHVTPLITAIAGFGQEGAARRGSRLSMVDCRAPRAWPRRISSREPQASSHRIELIRQPSSVLASEMNLRPSP
jgi:hypothetical protein